MSGASSLPSWFDYCRAEAGSTEGQGACKTDESSFLRIHLVMLPTFIIFALDFNLIKMSEKPLNRLKVVLAENQKTSKWLAEQLGVSATVSKWVTNTAQPNLENLMDIARCLKVNRV